MTVKVDMILDCKDLACPIPIVRTKRAIDTLEAGQVIEVETMDKGSLADIQSWAKNVGHQYLGTKEEGKIFKHYVRKASPEGIKEVITYPHTITNEELKKKLASEENYILLDVREPAEFAFGHIPSAILIPLGELEERYGELDQMKSIYVICRTGNLSDLACQSLQKHGFSNVRNVIPGMSEWQDVIEKQ